jgi:hypothetical protein
MKYEAQGYILEPMENGSLGDVDGTPRGIGHFLIGFVPSASLDCSLHQSAFNTNCFASTDTQIPLSEKRQIFSGHCCSKTTRTRRPADGR